MSKIVARMQKMKSGNLTGIGNHNQRKTKNHSNEEIDKSRSDLNYDLVDRTENYKKDIERFIEENKSTKRAVRKDAVLVNEWIVTSDKDFFEGLIEGETENFFARAKDYFADKFGEENIRYATVHLDESTPHMHLGIVPFDDDNKLSSKRVFNRQALRDVQEELPSYLQKFGYKELQRGEKGSTRKNLTVPEFKEMKKEEKKIETEIDDKRKLLSAYVRDRKLTTPIDDFKIKKEMKDVKVASGEKFLNYKFKETVSKPTGNLIISEEDFKRLKGMNSYIKDVNGKLLNLLDTDVYQENKELKEEIKNQKEINIGIFEDYKDVSNKYGAEKKENKLLRSEISDLKAEIKLIYKSTKQVLKERINGIKAFKSVFKDVVDDLTDKVNNSGLNNHFKREFDKDEQKEKDKERSKEKTKKKRREIRR